MPQRRSQYTEQPIDEQVSDEGEEEDDDELSDESDEPLPLKNKNIVPHKTVKETTYYTWIPEGERDLRKSSAKGANK